MVSKMEQGKKTKRPRRSFTDEFKAEAVLYWFSVNATAVNEAKGTDSLRASPVKARGRASSAALRPCG